MRETIYNRDLVLLVIDLYSGGSASYASSIDIPMDFSKKFIRYELLHNKIDCNICC